MTSRTILIAVTAIVVICGAFWYLNSSMGGSTASTTHEFTLTAANGKLVSGPSELDVRQGDTVIINITCDEDEELHLHGYDRSVDLVPGKTETLTLIADVSGHFPFELEHRKAELGALVVAPN